MPNKAVAENLRVLCNVMAEPLCNREPHAIRRENQGTMLAESDLHSLDKGMAPAANVREIPPRQFFGKEHRTVG